ncbi:MAG: DNA translocase FtsK [Moorea sp. SIO3I7]|nr:DNA translocase FtsK [Moorena sp. SIO3I7]
MDIQQTFKTAKRQFIHENTQAWSLALAGWTLAVIPFTPFGMYPKISPLARLLPAPSMGLLILSAVKGSKVDQKGDWLMMAEGANTLAQQSQILASAFPKAIRQNTGDPIVDAMLNKWAEFGMMVKFVGKSDGAAFHRYYLEPLSGQKVDKLDKYAQDLQIKLKLDTAPVVTYGKMVNVDIPRTDRQFIEYRTEPKPDGLFHALLGYDINNNPITVDFGDPSNPHYFVGGCTGSGKTMQMQTMLVSMLDWYTPDELQFAIIDTKATDFRFCEKLGRYLWKPVVYDPTDAVGILSELVAEMDRRGELFRVADVGNIADYPEPLPRIAVFNDEITDLTAHQDKEIRETAQNQLTLLGAKGRAFGIHVFAGTQKPDGKRLPTAFRDNLPVKLTLKTTGKGDSKLITGHLLPSNHLLGKGDGFLVVPGKEPLRIQAPFINPTKSTQYLPHLPARDQVVVPLPKPKDHELTEVETKAVLETYKETKSVPKTVTAMWGLNKTGTVGSPYQQARALVTKLIEDKAV